MEQLAARRAHNPKVGGSSPPPATKKKDEHFCSSFFILSPCQLTNRNRGLLVGTLFKAILYPQKLYLVEKFKNSIYPVYTTFESD